MVLLRKVGVIALSVLVQDPFMQVSVYWTVMCKNDFARAPFVGLDL